MTSEEELGQTVIKLRAQLKEARAELARVTGEPPEEGAEIPIIPAGLAGLLVTWGRLERAYRNRDPKVAMTTDEWRKTVQAKFSAIDRLYAYALHMVEADEKARGIAWPAPSEPLKVRSIDWVEGDMVVIDERSRMHRAVGLRREISEAGSDAEGLKIMAKKIQEMCLVVPEDLM